MNCSRFITFEGVDGAGKSTHLERFADSLRMATNAEVVLTREPGGTPLGETLRTVLLSTPMHLETEALLMFAARRQHLADVILPALARGAWVVCDRFTDSTIAYQGAGRGLSRDKLDELQRWVHDGITPTLTIVFDLDPAIAAERMAGTRDKDRFELEQHDFFVRVRDAYLALSKEPDRSFTIIDGSKSIDEIRFSLDCSITLLAIHEMRNS